MWFAQSLVGVLRAKYTERNLLEIKLESLYYILGLFTSLDKRIKEGWVKTQDSLFQEKYCLERDEKGKMSCFMWIFSHFIWLMVLYLS